MKRNGEGNKFKIVNSLFGQKESLQARSEATAERCAGLSEDRCSLPAIDCEANLRVRVSLKQTTPHGIVSVCL